MKRLFYCFLMAALMMLAAASCSKLLDMDDLSTGDADGYVDMGLSVKWKNRNAGAGQPQQIAEYYTFQDMMKNLTNIPTKEQAEELLANCTVKRATLKGNAGVLLTSKITQNKIFFPYGGLYNSGKLLKGKDAYFWTKTDEALQAWFFYFNQVFHDKEYPDGVQYDISQATVDLKFNVRQVK